MSPEQREALQWAVKVLDEVMEGDEPQATIRAMLTTPAASTPPEGKVRELLARKLKDLRGIAELTEYGKGELAFAESLMQAIAAQPDGVRELCECGHPLDVHRGINGCLADWEKPGFELGCRCKKFKLTTPAASTKEKS